jgi:membrane-associated protease RseP (regulator of RpoE activity)
MQGRGSLARFARTALLAAACAVAALAWLRAREASLRADALARDVAALGERLAGESAARAALESEAALLRSVLALAPAAAVESAVGAAAAEGQGAAAATPPEDLAVATTPADAAEPTAGLAASPEEAQPFDVDRLVAAGFRREDVERFRARSDQIDLARIYLRDRATREGWLGTPQFHEEMRALAAEQAGLRGEFDESLYDWMLFASGQPNRVGVAEVIAGSAAESAGLARGDVIVRYDERLMLSVQDLLGATNEGRAGELVAVEVKREGQSEPVRVFLPRGPIGVRIAPVAVEPGSRG